MKLGTFANPKFYDAFQLLLNASLPVATAYKLKVLSETLDKESRRYQESRRSIGERYALRDADGKPKMQNNTFELDQDNIEKVVKEIQDLNDIDFSLPFKISLDALESIQMSANDFGALEPLLDLGSDAAVKPLKRKK